MPKPKRNNQKPKDNKTYKTSNQSCDTSRRKIIKTIASVPLITNPLGYAVINVIERKEIRNRKARENYLSLEVIRPIDLLKLTFRFYNCQYQKRDQFTFVVKDNRKKQSFLVVIFPSQHTLEQAFLEAENQANNEPLKLPAKFIRAGKSRLVYELPMEFDGIPLTMEKLLDWSNYKLKINYRARITLAAVVPPTSINKQLNLKDKTIPQNYGYIHDQDIDHTKVPLADNPKYKTQNRRKYDLTQLEKILPKNEIIRINEEALSKTVKKNQLQVAPPAELETSIEAPARLFISPNQLNDFTHILKTNTDTRTKYTHPPGNIQSLTIGDPLNKQEGVIVELWHSRMGVKMKNGYVNENTYPQLKTIRALWSTDFDNPAIEQPFRAPLDSRDRYLLVRETSDYGIQGYTPRPVQARQLFLSALGSWLNFDGNFDYPDREGKGLELLKWQHRATMGRDQFVKVVQAGFLYPFGHKASLVKISERKVDPATKVAAIRKRYFVVVMEKEKLYAGRDNKNNFIPFPFQSVEILTAATPNLDHTDSILNLSTEAPKSNYDESTTEIPVYNFWMEVGGNPFLFDLITTDKEGQMAGWRIPMIFISESGAFDSSAVDQINDVYNGNTDRATSAANGQVVAYAESLVENDTNLVTQSIRFGAMSANQGQTTAVKFHPVMQSASVMVKAVEELTGDSSPVDIRMHDDVNDAGLFAELISTKMLDFNGSADKSGGMMNPNAGIRALTKLQGPVGGQVDDMANLDFDPTEFFNDNASLGGVAKLFGVIPIFELLFGSVDVKSESADLKDVLSGINEELEEVKSLVEAKKKALDSAAEEAKAAIQAEIDGLQAQIAGLRDQLEDTLSNVVPKIPGLKMYSTGRAMVVEYKWMPELEQERSFFSFLTVRMNGDPKDSMHVTTKLVRPYDTAQPTEMGIGSGIELFSIEIAELLKVNFDFIRFDTGTGKKTKVNVGLDQDEAIVFLGPLAFVNNLQNIIPGDGFGEGPYINLQPTGVKAGFELGIPNVEVGVLSIANITLGAYVRLPFTGAPMTLGFNFCRRDNPFLLTVSCFGGGGFFLMETSVKGFMMMEAAFEFGAAISFDVGIASGGVSVMGGFYFKMEMVDEFTQIVLTGYIRINGALSILGLITLSLEFYLALTYIMKSAADSKAGKLYGEATVKVKVEVLFFSKSVSVTARRTLKGADADPTFAQMIEEPDWMEYCAAFA